MGQGEFSISFLSDRWTVDLIIELPPPGLYITIGCILDITRNTHRKLPGQIDWLTKVGSRNNQNLVGRSDRGLIDGKSLSMLRATRGGTLLVRGTGGT